MNHRFSYRLLAIPAFAAATLAASALGSPAAFATGNVEINTTGGTITNRIWGNGSIPITWRYNLPLAAAPCSYSSANAPIATLRPAVVAGFTAWQNNPDSTIAFIDGGNTATTNVGADGNNIVTFCGNGIFTSGVLARTTVTSVTSNQTVVAGGGCPAGQGLLAGVCFPTGSYPAGTIVDADIEFNTKTPATAEASLSTNGTSPGTFDVQAIVTHEQGHFFGLSHDPIFEAVMYAFIDDIPFSDGIGQRVLKPTDLTTSSHYYREATFAANYGSITGIITLDGSRADGVHVVAINPTTLLGYEGKFSISRFEEPTATPNVPGTEGPDFSASGAAFYRIDGLPAGNYHVYVEYFDNSDFFTGRLQNRYNSTVANSNVVNGATIGALGFLPALTEFYNTGETGDGGDGIDPGTATDNSDTASLVAVTAGNVTSGIDIAINIEPINGEGPAQRQNPTTRSVIFNDNILATDIITAFLLDADNNNYYAVRVPAGLLPAPPYNIAEARWIRYGLNTLNYVSGLAYENPSLAATPALNDPVVASSGRVLSGGPGGKTAAGDVVDVVDQLNVTINEPRDVYLFLNQPPSPGGITFLSQGFFALGTCRTDLGPGCPPGSARVNRTMFTLNGGSSWTNTTQFDLFYDLILEADPPVMINSTAPSSLFEGQTGNVIVNGVGFLTGAAVDFGPNITVNTVTFLSATQLQCNITVANTGAIADRAVNVKVTNPSVLFPNVARVFTVTPDTDADGVGNAADCNPFDATLKHPATEAQNVRVTRSGGSASVAWTSQDLANGSATTYDVVTGLLANLRTSNGYALATCAVNDHPDTPFLDATPVATATGRYWLVRAQNACNGGFTTYGNSGLVPDPRDALDSGTPCP